MLFILQWPTCLDTAEIIAYFPAHCLSQDYYLNRVNKGNNKKLFNMYGAASTVYSDEFCVCYFDMERASFFPDKLNQALSSALGPCPLHPIPKSVFLVDINCKQSG